MKAFSLTDVEKYVLPAAIYKTSARTPCAMQTSVRVSLRRQALSRFFTQTIRLSITDVRYFAYKARSKFLYKKLAFDFIKAKFTDITKCSK